MANYNIELKKRNTANTGWDSLYPITQAANVVMQDGKSVEQKVSQHLADGIQHKIVDPESGSKYVWGIENGQLFLQEVG